MASQTAASVANSVSSTANAPEHDSRESVANEMNPATPDGRSHQRRDRPRMTLPDPLPTTPHKRYPEPNMADLKQKIDHLLLQMHTCFDRLKCSKDVFDQKSKIRDESKPQYDAAKKRLNELNESCRLLFEQKKTLSNRIKALKDIDMGFQGSALGDLQRSPAGWAAQDASSKDGYNALRGCRTVEEVDARIVELEAQHMSSSLSLEDEKKIVAQISFLTTKGKDIILSKELALKEEKAARDKRIDERKSLEERRKALDTEIDAVKAEVEKQKQGIGKLRSEQEEKLQSAAAPLKDIDREAEKKKIGEIREQVQKLREQYQKDHDAWYLNELIVSEQIKIAKRKRMEAIQAEREEKRKAWEAEQAQYPVADPYQPEKDMCASLIHLLNGLMGVAPADTTIKADSTKSSLLPVSSVKPTSLGSKKAKGEDREIARVEGGKAIGKSTNANKNAGFDDEAYGIFATKTSGKKNRRGRRPEALSQSSSSGSPSLELKSNGTNKEVTPGSAVAKDEMSTPSTKRDGMIPIAEDKSKLKALSMDHLTFFAKLGIKAPTRRCDLAAALEAVFEKKNYFDNNPPEKDADVVSIVNGVVKGPSKVRMNGAGPISVDGPDSDAAFPELGTPLSMNSEGMEMSSSASGPSDADVGRPSFSDIAKGSVRSMENTLLPSEAGIVGSSADGGNDFMTNQNDMGNSGMGRNSFKDVTSGNAMSGAQASGFAIAD